MQKNREENSKWIQQQLNVDRLLKVVVIQCGNFVHTHLLRNGVDGHTIDDPKPIAIKQI